MPSNAHVLFLSCPNRPGIVAAVSGLLFERGCNILDAQQFDDAETGRFFMRVVFTPGPDGAEAVRPGLAGLAADLSMDWTLRDPRDRRRVMILASQTDHCLADLIWRWRQGELPMDISAVVSNHPETSFPHTDLKGIAFHHLPVSPETKADQEARLSDLIAATGTDLVILARYMQILSEDMALRLQFLAQLGVVLDDAVMHHHHARRGVRMRIALGRRAMGGPARMADADGPPQRVLIQHGGEVHGCGGLSTAALLIDTGRNAHPCSGASTIAWSCVLHHPPRGHGTVTQVARR
jgi:predicted amino acid-binding ACT domain protein